MAKADILQDGVYMPEKMGWHHYVWRKPGPKPMRNRACVISAHGIDLDQIDESQYPKPSVPLYFYGPHGQALDDATVMGIMRGQTRHYEKTNAGCAAHDYVLSKAQGYHSTKSKETYGNIQKHWHEGPAKARAREDFEVITQGIDHESHRYQAMEADLAKVLAAYTDIVVDVVTIRNRTVGRGGITLWQTVQLLEKYGYHYSAIHCNFCRGTGSKHFTRDNLHAFPA